MLSNLPRDLEEEILSRVPVTSLRRLRSTCKRWYHHALFKDPRFIKTHFDKTARQRQYQAFMLMNVWVYPVRSINDSGLLTDKLHLNNHLSDSEAVISKAFHCDSILLCTTKDNRLMAWNPFSGKTRWIKPRNHHMRSEFYAFGYDNKELSLCRSYKILRVTDFSEQTMEIYEFRSNSWSNLDASPGGSFESLGVSLKGNTYWVSKRGGLVKDYSLLKFDFSTERLQDLRLPFHEAEYMDTFALSVVKEERLCLLHRCAKTRKMEIWLTTSEIDETAFASWSKFLTVDLIPDRLHVLFSSRTSFFIDEVKKVAVCCVPNTISSSVFIVGEDVYEEFEFAFGGPECMKIVFGYVTYVPRLF